MNNEIRRLRMVNCMSNVQVDAGRRTEAYIRDFFKDFRDLNETLKQQNELLKQQNDLLTLKIKLDYKEKTGKDLELC